MPAARILVAFALFAIGSMPGRANDAKFAGIQPPASIGGFTIGDTHSYSAPELGHSVTYKRGPAWADVYIYDGGEPDIPDGPSSPQVLAQFEQAAGDIAGNYPSVRQTSDFSFPATGRAKLRCSGFDIVTKDKKLDSILCLTGARQNFVKFRISAPTGALERDSVDNFLNAWADLLW